MSGSITTRRLGAFLLAACLPAYGCGDGAGASEAATAAVDTVNGVERLRYPAETARPLGWTADTLLVLGDAFADDAYQFNEINPQGLVGDPDGSLLVLDRQGKASCGTGPRANIGARTAARARGPASWPSRWGWPWAPATPSG